MSLLGRQSIILDTLKQKIQLVKNELDRYKEDYTHCQMTLAHELQQRSQAQTENMELQQHNTKLEDELHRALHQVDKQHTTLREARNALSESDRLRKALEHRDQLQTEKIELLNWEMCKLRRQAKEADRTAEYSDKRAAQLTESLTLSEQQLEASLASHDQLMSELNDAAQNLKCVERAFERSAQQVREFDRQVNRLQRRLQETERRAHLAELSAQQLQQQSFKLEEQLEQRCRDKFNKIDVPLNRSTSTQSKIP